jgi:hypothetical protein
MLKILCLILISTAIVSASSFWELRRKRYDILRRIAKPPSIKEIQAKHELQRLRLIRGEPIDGTPTKKTYLRNQRNKK